MRLKMSIKSNMLLYILTTTVLIFLFSFGYIGYKTRLQVIDDAQKLALSVTKENAVVIEKSFEKDLSMLETLSQVFTLRGNMNEQEWKSYYAEISKKIFAGNDNLIGFTYSMEEMYYDTTLSKNETRYFYHLDKINGKISERISIKNLVHRMYANAKATNKSLLQEPEFDADGTGVKSYLLNPIHFNNKFAGYVVGDFLANSFRKTINNIKPYKSTVGYLISNNGLIVSHPDESVIGDTMVNQMSYFEEQFQLSTLIQEGEANVFKGLDDNNEPVLLAVAPVQVGENKTPWALVLVTPVNEILKQANKTQLISIIVAILGIILISLIIYQRANSIGVALSKTTKILEKLSVGDVEQIQDLNLNRGDEIDVMVHSVNTLKDSLNATSDFANQIGIGNLDAAFTPMGENDKLGNSLLNMQKNLIKAKVDEDKMKLIEEQNNWTSVGLAKFGDIIRSNNEDLNKLSYNIVKNLVDYLGASMGALFVADNENENEEPFYVAKAAVAYERKKLLSEKIRIGEGLIGRCVFEKLSIYMKDIPQNYISIRSGLGDATPSVLLLVPLISEDKVYGVVELASFDDIEDYKRAFVEKLAESIASTLSSVQINQRTIKLLEQSKFQSEELAAQEEEMRQNMEELQATQEEAARREQELISMLDILENSVFKVEYDLSGKIININNKYLSFLNTAADILNDTNIKNEYQLMGKLNADSETIWPNLLMGKQQTRTVNAIVNKASYVIEEHYYPIILHNEEKPSKIIKIAYVITQA